MKISQAFALCVALSALGISNTSHAQFVEVGISGTLNLFEGNDTPGLDGEEFTLLFRFDETLTAVGGPAGTSFFDNSPASNSTLTILGQEINDNGVLFGFVAGGNILLGNSSISEYNINIGGNTFEFSPTTSVPQISGGSPPTFGDVISTDFFSGASIIEGAPTFIVNLTASYSVTNGQLILDTDVVLGDVNDDGVVDLLDVQPFVDIILGNSPAVDAADLNGDGIVDLLDVQPFVELLLG